MKKWFNTRGLKFKLWAYFVFFAALIMVLLWLLEIFFLGAFYEQMKLNQIDTIGNKIIAEYGSSDFDEKAFELSYRNGIMVRFYNADGQAVSGGKGDMFSGFRQDKGNAEEIRQMINNIRSSAHRKLTMVTNSPHMGGAHEAVFGAELTDQNGVTSYVSISTPLVPVDATTQVLKNQLLLVTVLSLLVSFILSYFIARKISAPITKMTSSAVELATGDYDVVFDEGGFEEIDELANVLNFATNELSKTDSLRRDLVANVSHDLRTPLTIIKSYAEMIRDLSGNNPEKRAVHTQVIIDETDRLSALVTDLLDLSKMEAGTVELHRTRFDLAGAVSVIMERFRVLSDSEDYKFITNCAEDCFVFADEQRIEQVIYNLVGNAVNYTSGDKKIYISVVDLGGQIRFEVTDTGKGIPPEEQNEIWERYKRASKTSGRAAKGTGIGLAIVKNILSAHRAHFGVQSAVGKGSTFWFELPKANE